MEFEKAKCPYCGCEQDVDTSKHDHGVELTVCADEDSGGCGKWYVYEWHKTVDTTTYAIEKINDAA